MKVLFALAAAVGTVLSASAAMATSYTGHWPYTISGSNGADGNYCLAVTDDGSFHWPHSGFGTLVDQNGDSHFATFQVIGTSFEVVVQFQGGNGQDEGMVVTASARNGTVGTGVVSDVLAGESVTSGKVAFGAKGGC